MASRMAQGVAVGDIKHAPFKYLAFCDVLGMKEAILQNFEQVGNLYFELIKMLREEYPTLLEELDVSIFSDSIVMVSDDIIQLIYATHALSEACMRKGFLIRGGIAYGRHYEDPNLANWLVVSEALVKAASLESTTKMPRIQLHPELCESATFLPIWLELFKGKNLSITTAFQFPLLYEHTCSATKKPCAFVNPFSPFETVHTEARDVLLGKRDDFLSEADASKYEKYNWLINLHDRLKDGHISPPQFVFDALINMGGRMVLAPTRYSKNNNFFPTFTFDAKFFETLHLPKGDLY